MTGELTIWLTIDNFLTVTIEGSKRTNYWLRVFISQHHSLTDRSPITLRHTRRDMTHFDSEDDYCTGCRNVSHCQQQQSYSGLRSPGQSNSTYFWNDSWVQTFHNNCFGIYTWSDLSKIRKEVIKNCELIDRSGHAVRHAKV